MPLGELIEWIEEDENRKRGEMVLLIHGHREQQDEALLMKHCVLLLF